jgi:hypothetical protein
MTTGLFRTLVLTRAMAIEPIGRAVYADPIDADSRPFGTHTNDRWRIAARRAAQSIWTTAAHDTDVGSVDAGLT